jgi:uridine phosphorylase
MRRRRKTRDEVEASTIALLENKAYGEPSVFEPGNLLREARRQKGLSEVPVPAVCILDPDGDLVRHVRRHAEARRSAAWACYHTELWEFAIDEHPVGVVGCAVGAAFAVLVAEELFASGCRLVLSVTSAGRVTAVAPPPYFVVIDRALRDEGTSYHYLAPSRFVDADAMMVATATAAATAVGVKVFQGSSWTTDAPFRETSTSLAAARALGVLAVEMEAAGLYAFAHAQRRPVLCLAHVTNTMGVAAGDFEKGDADGALDTLAILTAVVRALAPTTAWKGHPP